jgi:outer membrane protein OmpA-like peptidoglycan-associated protein
MITPMRVAIVCAAVSAMYVASAPATAEPRRIEASGFLGIDYFGDDIELGNSWAMEQKPGTALLMGVRLAFIALPGVAMRGRLDLGVELETKFAAAYTGGSFDGGRPSYFSPVIGWRGHGLARWAFSPRFAWHVLIGGGGESVASTSPYMADDTDAIFYYGGGPIWNVSSRWAVRLDARHGFTAGRTDAITQTIEVQLGAGARWELGTTRKRPPPRVTDSDDDGILDDVDRCPAVRETMNGFEDGDGCPDDPDQDGDGIVDSNDGCPLDAEDRNGIDDDDGCPDRDVDADGVLGSQDACPDAPEDRDGYEDLDGCPELDNDGDGIPDTADACPMEPEVWNGITDDDGCKDELPAKVRAFEGTMKGINFQSGKAKILKSSRKALAKTVEVLREFPQLRIKIEGHTDGKGARDKNLALSRRRADAVKWYLVDAGIAEDRIETEGVGPDRPVANDRTKGGRAKNRRIEFHVLPGVPPNAAPATQPSAPATQPSQ